MRIDRPDPFQSPSDDSDHALVPIGAGHGIRAPGAPFRRPLFDLGHGLPEDPALYRLALAVQLLEGVGQPARLRLVLGEQELERLARVAEASRCVQARGEAEPDGPCIGGSWVHARALHERAKTGFPRAREGAQAGDRKRAVLVYERDDVGDRRERDEVEVSARHLAVDAEEGLPELVDDAGAAQLGERIQRGPGRDDGAVWQRLGGPVMVGDDDVETAFLRLGHLSDGRDAAVDGEDEPTAVVRKTGERLAPHAVALVEAARQMPDDLSAELAQQEDGERGGGDAVDVIVAVDADPATLLHGGADVRARSLHVAEQERVVRGLLPVEETPGDGRIGVAAPEEYGGGQLRDPERANELGLAGGRAIGECPGAFVHLWPSYGDGRTELALQPVRLGRL